MPRDKRDVESGLGNKGFRLQDGDHHYFVYWSEEGKKSMAKTKTSHGSGRDISDDLLAKMSKQCGLTKGNFLKLVDCPLSRKEYEALLKAAGKL
jgi:hypothetical protein